MDKKISDIESQDDDEVSLNFLSSDCYRKIIEKPSSHEKDLDFLFLIPFGNSFRNFIEFSKKFNKELHMYIYKDHGVLFISYNNTNKNIYYEALFDKRCFTEFYCSENIYSYVMEISNLNKFIKQIKKNDMIKFSKNKSTTIEKKPLNVSLCKNSVLKSLDHLSDYHIPSSGIYYSFKNLEMTNYSIMDKISQENKQVNQIRSLFMNPNFEYFISSFSFCKIISFLAKTKNNFLNFKFYSNKILIENFSYLEGDKEVIDKKSKKIISLYNKNVVTTTQKKKDPELGEILVNLNVLLCLIKIKNINSEGSLLKFKLLNKDIFMIETIIGNNGIIRFIFKNTITR